MKKLLLLLALLLLTQATNAQTPYEIFGHKGKVLQTQTEKTGENIFDLVAVDSLNECQTIRFDFSIMKISMIDKTGNLLIEADIDLKIAKRWFSRDPMEGSFPDKSPFNFVSGNPINRIDPTGMADYYSRDGKKLGNDKIDDNRTMLADKKTTSTYIVTRWNKAGYTSSYEFTIPTETITHTVFENAVDLEIGHDLFMGLASAIHHESSWKKSRIEGLKMGISIMNILDKPRGKLETLEDYVMFENTVIYGSKKKHYKDFINFSEKMQNSRYAIEGAINAWGFSQGLPGFQGFSDVADAWDGLDLVATSSNNEHRTWSWTKDSKVLLKKFKKFWNGGVKVTDFKYVKKGAQLEALSIGGGTVFCKNLGGVGGRFKEKIPKRFVPKR